MKITNKKRLLILIVLFLSWPILQLTGQEVTVTVVYQFIKEYGKTTELEKKRSDTEAIFYSKDGQNGYLTYRETITNEAQLLKAMGASHERELSDIQKGLLEVFRTVNDPNLRKLDKYQHDGKRTIVVYLTDFNLNDLNRYPSIKQDLWPQVTKLQIFSDNKPEVYLGITMSGLNCISCGTRTSEIMKATFAHEYAHTFDLNYFEYTPYGYDGVHYWNEVIQEKAAFSEGFANFVQILICPSMKNDFRDALSILCIETAPGSYSTFQPGDPNFKGIDYLRVEAINALILHRLATEIPNGLEKVFTAFKKSNSTENTMIKFLKTFASNNPEFIEIVAKILDEETYGQLSDEEFKNILGNTTALSAYLQARNKNKITSPTSQPSGELSSSERKRIYKWTDNTGRIHFTDYPPPENIKYDLLSPTNNASKVENQGSNPFFDE